MCNYFIYMNIFFLRVFNIYYYLRFIEILKKNYYKWPYALLFPLGVLSLSINLYRVSNYLYTLINIISYVHNVV